MSGENILLDVLTRSIGGVCVSSCEYEMSHFVYITVLSYKCGTEPQGKLMLGGAKFVIPPWHALHDELVVLVLKSTGIRLMSDLNVFLLFIFIHIFLLL